MAKSNRKSPFNRDLARAISEHVPQDGTCVTREELAKKLGKRFTVDHPEMLRILIGLAVSSGSCPGLASVRGPGGGVYRVAARTSAE